MAKGKLFASIAFLVDGSFAWAALGAGSCPFQALWLPSCTQGCRTSLPTHFALARPLLQLESHSSGASQPLFLLALAGERCEEARKWGEATAVVAQLLPAAGKSASQAGFCPLVIAPSAPQVL